MGTNKDKYSPEFKSKVALEALGQSKKNLRTLSDKYSVPVSVILIWTAQLERNAATVYEHSSEPTDVGQEPEPVDIEIHNDVISRSINQGVMSDDLNYRRLISWSLVGLVVILIFSQMLVEMYQINVDKTPEQVAGNEPYREVTEKKREAEAKISSFGIIDDENGIYSVPVDMVIEQMAEENESQVSPVEFEADSLIQEFGDENQE